MAKRPELEIANGELAGKRYTVTAEGLRLGRSSSNDIHVPDEELSRNHCLFEPCGENDIRITDLASANGTFLNGTALGNDPVVLKVGDRIDVGKTTVRVVDDSPKPVESGTVDLGLNGKTKPALSKRRSPLANVLWGLAVLVAAVAIYLILVAPPTSDPTVAEPLQNEEEPTVREVYYEKVEANSEGIFRYEMALSNDGVLKVSIDDVPKENRHLTKSQPLNEAARAEIGSIVAFKNLQGIDREYAGAEPDPPALESWTLRVVYDSRFRIIRVVNTQEPPAFRVVREKLEAFSKNQLGIWAIQYSREKLIQLAEESVALGKAKWEDRDVQHGNLFGSIAAYKEALFYLETVNPKPDFAATARQAMETAQNELDRRYRDQRFLADRAINLQQWETAQRELAVLMELIPDRTDDRNREASAKLVDVEKRMKGGK